MDPPEQHHQQQQQESFSSQPVSDRPSSTGRLSGSWRRASLSISRQGSTLSIPEDLLDEINAQAGDSGGRPFVDHDVGGPWPDAAADMQQQQPQPPPLADDAVLLSTRFRVHPSDLYASPVSPLESDITSYDHLPASAADLVLISRDDNMSRSVREIKRSMSIEDKAYVLPMSLDYMQYLLHLAVFGILGAITRYLLQKLFGPGILKFTSDDTSFYLDLPSNMLGSFLMGWFGVVFKGDLRQISDHVVVGITTGYLGSLTTFSGWNQKMLVLSSNDHWVYAIAGVLIGMLLVNESINIGVETAESFRSYIIKKLGSDGICIPKSWKIDRPSRHATAMVVMLLTLGGFWITSGVLVKAQMDDLSSNAILWLGCLLAPTGVWLRWYLARLNGQGIGRKKRVLKWLPVGTLAANVLAACVMAALATINKVVNTRRCYLVVSGVQFGFLGCLSTVSTFAAEVYAMRQTKRPGRAFTYVSNTLIISFVLGTLIYSVPVWKRHYK